MGELSYEEHWRIYGGPPEPGECFPDDPDALRDQADEERAQPPSLNAFLGRVVADVRGDGPVLGGD